MSKPPPGFTEIEASPVSGRRPPAGFMEDPQSGDSEDSDEALDGFQSDEPEPEAPFAFKKFLGRVLETEGDLAREVTDPVKLYKRVQEYLPAAAGISAGIAATPAAGVLAAQGTDFLRRGANVALGIPTPTNPLEIALGNIGEGIAAGPGEFVPPPVKKLAGLGMKAVGGGLKRLLQTTTGVGAERFSQMFKHPDFPLPVVSTVRKWLAGKGVEKALAKEGFNAAKEGKEVFDPLLSQARRSAIKASDLAENAINRPGRIVSPEEVRVIGNDLVKGKRAINRVIRGTSYKDRASVPDMVDKARKVDLVLSELSPQVKKAMTRYSQAAMAAEFSNLLPLIMSGNVSYVKSLVPAMAALGGTITPAGVALGTLSSPFLMGTATALAGVIAKAMKVPALRTLILSEAAQKATGE
jgi:hypothetical protein